MSLKKKKQHIFLCIAGSILLFVLWVIWADKALELNTYTIRSESLPPAFHGYRIAHVSDLHNTEIGNKNEILLAMIKSADPDIIAITGDMIDSRNTDVGIALQFAQEAVKIAPCYYVTGNHEERIDAYAQLRKGLIEIGVTVLEDETVYLKQSDEAILLIGINDPNFQTKKFSGDAETVTKAKLENLTEESVYTILLSHRPELFEIYAEYDMDLVLSGHAHGGQFRLPLIGGLYAPHQGLFPEHDAGLYTKNNTNLIVSRGIGNSLFPFRFNNRPEVIAIELQTK